MKPVLLVVILLASLLLNVGFLISSWRAQVVISVPDGDSLQLRDGRRVRLLGIDAPEKGRCMAEEAREQLSYLARGKHVRLKDRVTDDYGRVLANVFVGGKLIQAIMIRDGLARGEPSAYARGKKLGIYSETCRKTAAPGGCAIKGNIREGKSVYYLPSCAYYDQVIVDESFGDQWFCNANEAQKAGFTVAESCR